MVFARTNVPAADLSYLALDYPCILAAHALRDAVFISQVWSETGGGGTDRTHPSGPVSRLYDGFAHHGLHSRPNGNQATWYLSFELGGGGIEFDTIVVFGSNLGNALGVQLLIWDAGGYGTAVELYDSSVGGSLINGTDKVRYLALHVSDDGALGPDTLYSGVKFLELRVGSAGIGFSPRIRELWLGKRIQLPFNANRPFGGRREASGVDEQVAMSGVRTGAGHTRGRVDRTVDLDLTEPSHRTTLRRLWDESEKGTERFLWIEQPSTAPVAYLMAFREPLYDPRLIAGDQLRSFGFDMLEQNPIAALDAA